MSQPELLRRVVNSLRRLNIPYMLTGSLASSLQGEPRSTHDVDLLVDLKMGEIAPLLDELREPNFYVSQSAVEAAVRDRRMFNLLETTTGDKVDFWLVTQEPFDQSRFQRRQSAQFLKFEVDVSSPEDTILMKLKWAKDSGGSEKQFNDALRVFEVQKGRLDLDYIEYWVDELDLATAWQRLVENATPVTASHRSDGTPVAD